MTSVILKGEKKKQDRQNKDCVRTSTQPIKMLQTQSTRMLLSAYLISIKIEQHPGENG
jgi:hypothetical protein